MNQPIGLIFGFGGDLYVTSELSNQVLRYNGSTGAFIGAFVSTGSGGLDRPAGLIIGPDGNLYVSSQNNDAMLRYNGTTGAFIDAFVPSGSGGLQSPIGLLFTPSSIPTLSEWAQILMIGLLVASALWLLARRRPATF